MDLTEADSIKKRWQELQKEKWGKHKYTETIQLVTHTQNKWVNEEIKEEIRKYFKTNLFA